MMNRRELLRGLAIASAASAVPAWATADTSQAEAFDQAVSAKPWLQPFKGITDAQGDLRSDALALRGKWPAALRGRFYRNGPAVFERGTERIGHWFGGDGMVQQFVIGERGVSHHGRLVETFKLGAEQKAGRFMYNGFGASKGGSGPVSGPDSFNVANTNALEHGGRLLALWEGGSAYGLDPATLSTQGVITWQDGLQQVPFSAHPKVDASGHLWNIGTSGDKIVAWHINPQGKLVKAQVGTSPYPGGMVHDMAVTPHYIVVPLPPVKQDNRAMIGGTPIKEAIRFETEQPLRVLVMDKDDISQRHVFELPAQMMFHVGNAHETADGHIELSYIGASDHRVLVDNAVALVTGGELPQRITHTCIVRLNMRTGRAVYEALNDQVEFPRIDPRLTGLPSRLLLTTTRWRPELPGRSPLWHGLQLRDLKTGRAERFDYSDDMLVEEHVLAPKPGRTGERDAWVLGTTVDLRRQRTVLNVLDAAHLADGPIAQATLPYLLPPGFHGNFTAV